MSVSIPSLFTLDELALELEWLKARDTLLGENCIEQDVKRALELAAASNHPQCQWFTSLFAGTSVTTVQEARDVFLSEGKKSPASLCFAALLSDPVDEALLRQSAELGCSVAQAWMVVRTEGEERFRLAKTAASQRERDGFCWLGDCYENGDVCERNLEKARECHVIGSQLGLVVSMIGLAALLDGSDPQRWVWWGRAAVLGLPIWFLHRFVSEVQKFNSGSGNRSVVFLIEKALNGHVSVEKRTVFGVNYYDFSFGQLIGPANLAISFYKSQLSSCRRAVDTWSLCCLRLNIYKDIRVFMGKMIWETRDLALFDVSDKQEDLPAREERPTAASSPIQKKARK
jgi:hypothetical protein